eukprot:TRINITY_DN16905_c0_g1_i1.p1 TRINITY_DN16905_c0_g1~~TRINITY_DN16905_c0_g1_i1.p1  ORF type:complete len:740 (-),score=162.35 TRINITY_DN16905_c0_g1_i1:31-1968(-)
MAQTISTEGRAMNNLGHAGLTYFAPNINLIRDPRWGRSQETPGEDPFLTSQYVIAYMRGMQQGDDPRYKKVIATCKHYAAYDLENWNGVDRHHFNAKVSDYDLYNTYLPAFEACVVKGGAGSIMCSYNEVNGVPSCANDFLNNQVARGEWNFDGYVVSDCGAIDNIQNTHNYTNTTSATIKAALEGGCDLDCGNYYTNNTAAAVQDGSVAESVVDTALTRLFQARMELGMFDPRAGQPYAQLGASDVNTAAAQELALQAARESVVVLQNNNNALPFPSTIETLAVVGPNGNATTVMQGNYQGQAPYLISPFDGFKPLVSTVTYVDGCLCVPEDHNKTSCPSVYCNSTANIPSAIAAVEQADAAVVILGISTDIEGEGQDRYNITLPGVQWELAKAAHQASIQGSKKPIVLVIMSGACIALPPEAKTLFDAIMWVGYPGQSGGQAIAEAVMGKFSPSGRLPYTMYPADYVDQVSFFDMDMRAKSGYPGRTYRYYTGTPLWEFGTGLSYSAVQYKWVDSATMPALVTAKHESLSETTVSFRCNVTNDGPFAQSVSVLAYITYGPDQGPDFPIKKLFGFQRTKVLQPSESQEIFFAPTLDELAEINEHGHKVLPSHPVTIRIGEASHTMTITRHVSHSAQRITAIKAK